MFFFLFTVLKFTKQPKDPKLKKELKDTNSIKDSNLPIFTKGQKALKSPKKTNLHQCPFCKNNFNTANGLDVHIKIVHEPNKELEKTHIQNSKDNLHIVEKEGEIPKESNKTSLEIQKKTRSSRKRKMDEDFIYTDIKTPKVPNSTTDHDVYDIGKSKF